MKRTFLIRMLALAVLFVGPSCVHVVTIDWRTADGRRMSHNIPLDVIDTEIVRVRAWYEEHEGDGNEEHDTQALSLAIEEVRLFRLDDRIMEIAGNDSSRFLEEAVSFGRTAIQYRRMSTCVRVPLISLVTGVGDCDDMSMLAAAVLCAAHQDAGVWIMEEHSHAALAVLMDATRYPDFFLETGEPDSSLNQPLFHDRVGSWYFVEMTDYWPIGYLTDPSYAEGLLVLPSGYPSRI